MKSSFTAIKLEKIVSEPNFDFFQSENNVGGNEAVGLGEIELGVIRIAMKMNVIFPEIVAKR